MVQNNQDHFIPKINIFKISLAYFKHFSTASGKISPTPNRKIFEHCISADYMPTKNESIKNSYMLFYDIFLRTLLPLLK